MRNRDDAVAFYERVTDPTAKAILDFLIDHPDERFDGAGIVKGLGLARHRQVAESTYLMGRIARELGLGRPWTESQIGYLMPVQQAAILRDAREQASAAASS